MIKRETLMENRKLLGEWLPTPEKERVPPTLNKLAEELGVTLRALHKWCRCEEANGFEEGAR
jgi:hypothetical protein